MLLTVTTTRHPATDLGFLLHKNPERAQVFPQSYGQAHVIYPEATDARTTAALLLEIDPIALVRGSKGRADFALGQYVNDRPYAASSLLAVALGQVFRTAMRGECKARPELAATPIPLEIGVPALPCRGGVPVVTELFAPLGWVVDAVPVALDPAFPEWGDSRYVSLTLRGTMRLADALNHLYVLLPVLDDAKHYWVSTDEIDKLIRAGEGWLATHPRRDLITHRYLAHRRELSRDAMTRLAESDDTEPERFDNATDPAPILVERPTPPTGTASDPAGTASDPAGTASDPAGIASDPAGIASDPAGIASDPAGIASDPAGPVEKPVPLAALRHAAVIAALRDEGAARVVDIGCGPGALLAELLADSSFTEIVGTDVSHRALEMAARRLKLDRMPDRRRERVSLMQSSVTYTDARLRGFDAAVLMEVIEHVDPPRVGALTDSVFGHAHPRVVVVTTPNVEHNARYDLPETTLRHPDHRFEWTRAEFAAWAAGTASRYGYSVRHVGVGVDDPEVGAPTQMAVFTR